MWVWVRVSLGLDLNFVAAWCPLGSVGLMAAEIYACDA